MARSRRVNRVTLHLPHRLIIIVSIGLAVAIAMPSWAESSPGSPGDGGYIPTPQENFARAKAAYEGAVRDEHEAEHRVDSAAVAARRAGKDYEAYLAHHHKPDNPVLHDAEDDVARQEQQVRTLREQAVAPLMNEHDYAAKVQQLAEAREEMDQLNDLRIKARYGGLFTPEQQKRTRHLAMTIAELDQAVYERQIGRLEEAPKYQAARKQLADARKNVRDLVKMDVKLDKLDPERRQIAQAVRKSSAALVAAERDLTAKRNARRQAYAHLLDVVAGSRGG